MLQGQNSLLTPNLKEPAEENKANNIKQHTSWSETKEKNINKSQKSQSHTLTVMIVVNMLQPH